MNDTPAGGGSYVFAKRSVNAGKQARHEEEMKRRRLKESLEAEFYSKPTNSKQDHRKPKNHTNSPSTEARHDPTTKERPVANGDEKPQEDNGYIASKPYRSRKGDRFS